MSIDESRKMRLQEDEAQKFNPKRKENLAIALGGLAGNNAFGAGVLEALLDYGGDGHPPTVPAMITASSGQVYWVFRYLQGVVAKYNGGTAKPLRDWLADDLAGLTPPGLLLGELRKTLPNKAMGALQEQVRQAWALWQHVPLVRDYAWWWLSLLGKPGRYATAFHNLVPDCAANALAAAREVMQLVEDRQTGKISVNEFLSSICPDRWIEPAFPDSFLKDISDLFNRVGDTPGRGIGVAFNAYNPIDGMEYIYLNERARSLLDREYGQPSSHRWRTNYRRIDMEAVRASLWLYAYGFNDGNSVLDGAYYRDVILSEACGKGIDRICAVRPVSYRWIGDMPRNYIDGKDLETEVAFNGAYAGERDKIMLVNKLVKEKKLTGYQPIDLVEIEPDDQRGYFEYIFEDMAVFDKALAKGRAAITEHALL